MAKLYIAANLVEATAWLGTAHLQFVYGNIGSLQELEVQAPSNTIFGAWNFIGVRSHSGETVNPDGTVSNHTSYISAGDNITNPQRYVRIEAPLGVNQTAENVWALLQKASLAIQESLNEMGTTINYDANQNSNSFVRTLLDIVGVNIGNVDQVFDTDEIGSLLVSTFPGYGRNVLDEAETGGFLGPHVQIGLNLVGTNGHDIINTGGGFDELDGGEGDDSINSGAGEDLVTGSLGNDFSDGGADSDTLDYSALGLNFTFALDTPASGAADAVFSATPDSGGWVDRFTDFETVTVEENRGPTRLSFTYLSHKIRRSALVSIAAAAMITGATPSFADREFEHFQANVYGVSEYGQIVFKNENDIDQTLIISRLWGIDVDPDFLRNYLDGAFLACSVHGEIIRRLTPTVLVVDCFYSVGPNVGLLPPQLYDAPIAEYLLRTGHAREICVETKNAYGTCDQ